MELLNCLSNSLLFGRSAEENSVFRVFSSSFVILSILSPFFFGVSSSGKSCGSEGKKQRDLASNIRNLKTLS